MDRFGPFRERVTFLKYDDETDQWSDFPDTPTVWAGVDALGDERYRIRVRYRLDLVGLKDASPTVRVLWLKTASRPTDRVMDVEDVTEVESRQFTHVFCKVRLIDSENLASGAKHRRPWPR